MYFSQGVWEGFTDLMATHPPLAKRIRAVDPTWDGEWGEPVGVAYPDASEAAAAFAPAVTNEDLVRAVDSAALQVGEPTLAHRQYAGQLIASIPDDVRRRAA